MLRAILVDDEPILLNKLKSLLLNNEQVEVVGAFTESSEAIRAATILEPNCAFLDIEMSEMNGIELAEQLTLMYPDIDVIFITAYNHYAVQAFEVNALDYILKPFRTERLDKAVERLLRKKGYSLVQTPRQCVIRCFGSFEITIDGAIIKWNRSKARELMAFFIQNESKWVSKYRICNELWPEYPAKQALAYLQTCIHRIRKIIKDAKIDALEIEYSEDRYILRIKNAQWDVQQFEKKYRIFLEFRTIKAAEDALEYCRGEYLDGEDWLWSDILREKYVLIHDEIRETLVQLKGSL
ncbi:response regulator [Paenibacillus sp. DMB5]|uniref:response regulator n=1 Tax=Paenibacillus sp. DMB5 TaxID=1780103 RepID=UPI00076DCEAD|nr:response regulator [Paenibacillus sp. DMB5]KUP20885.1 hypothetical protein AWJ19_06360 [Paenibacillus sp. DMB5]